MVAEYDLISMIPGTVDNSNGQCDLFAYAIKRDCAAVAGNRVLSLRKDLDSPSGHAEAEIYIPILKMSDITLD